MYARIERTANADGPPNRNDVTITAGFGRVLIHQCTTTGQIATKARGARSGPKRAGGR